MIKAGDNPHTYMIIYISTICFFFILMENYYTGIMVFAPINAVDDGIFLFCAIGLIGGYYGHNIFDTKMILFGVEHKLTNLIIASFAIFLPLMAVNACYSMYI